MRTLLQVTVAFGCLGLIVASGSAAAAEKLSPVDAASQVDQTLLGELTAESGSTPDRAAACDDETYLRRVSLDLIGELPSPEQVTAFVLDPAADKRSRLVERLLADERFGQNWARYWRDVILYRRTDDRGLISAEALQQYLTAAFNDGQAWDDIATSFVTATGDVRENGQTALIMAQMGAAEETTAEVARIFLGIQIQCAQCHDHPTDRWKRTEFHELAAFFPRIAVRPVRDADRRSFEVVSVDRDPRQRRPNANQRRGSTEHYMPDLDDPTARGTLMQPTFFVTRHRVEEGKTDQERRTILANLMTGESNPWFDRAFVNRVWAEMVGEGFYEPVDDMGPDRQCSAPQTLDLLATQFRANGRDVKWLYRTVAATSAYSLDSRSRREPDEAPFAANCLQRLRADQLMAALSRALGVSFDQGRGGGPYGFRGLQGQFVQTFGYDPSEPRDEMAGSIPQALLMMNSPILARAINAANVNTALGRLLAENTDDETVVVELYLRTLAREPSDAELATSLDYVAEVGNRREAFEDLQWALVNSTEFLHRK